MRQILAAFTLCAAVSLPFAAMAQAAAPAGSTGSCKDGTYTTAASKRGACSGHGGVKDWFSTATPAASAPAAPAAMAAPAPAAAPAAAPASAPAAPMAAKSAPAAAPATAAAASTAGKVWLNTSSNVYHCPGDKYYGNTKNGAYMTEAEAKAKGAHADHNKPCA